MRCESKLRAVAAPPGEFPLRLQWRSVIFRLSSVQGLLGIEVRKSVEREWEEPIFKGRVAARSSLVCMSRRSGRRTIYEASYQAEREAILTGLSNEYLLLRFSDWWIQAEENLINGAFWKVGT